MEDIRHTAQGIAEAIEAVNNLDNLDQAAYNAAKLKDAKNLLAAAPELLAACEAALYELTMMAAMDANEELVQVLETAINKAKGA